MGPNLHTQCKLLAFLIFPSQVAIFPLASAGTSAGSTCQGSWSFQEAEEKEVQERWAGCQEERVTELVRLQSQLLRSRSSVQGVVKDWCFCGV